MKISNYFFTVLMLASSVVLMSCGKNSQVESKTVAEDKNDEKFDTKGGEENAQFVVDEVSAAYAEIKLDEVAEQRSVDEDVKDLARILKNEHTSLLKDLQKYATSKAMSIPTEATDKAQASANDLAIEKGFDRKWCADIRDMHKQMIDDFEKASTSLTDPDLKEWATIKLNSLRATHDNIMAVHEHLK